MKLAPTPTLTPCPPGQIPCPNGNGVCFDPTVEYLVDPCAGLIANPPDDIDWNPCPPGQIPCPKGNGVCFDPTVEYLVDPCAEDLPLDNDAV